MAPRGVSDPAFVLTDPVPPVDGRRLRRRQNREAVLDAMLELFGEEVYDPSTAEIAGRAGLSPRSLFRYFDDVDDLHRAAIERQLDTARPLVDVDVGPDAPTTAKISRLVAARILLFEAIGPAARAARVLAHRHPIVAAQIHGSRSYLRRQIGRLFEPELEGDRSTLLATIDALCSFETYDLLRHEQGLSRPATEAALVGTLEALLVDTEEPR